jgi:hypothetical protein
VRKAGELTGEYVSPRIATTELPKAAVGSEYRVQLSVVGGIPPYRWEYVGEGRPPEGVDLEAGRDQWSIAGTPSKAEETKFRLAVWDSKEETDQKPLALVVESGPEVEPLKIATGALPCAVEGREYRCTLAAEGGMPPYRWGVKGGLPRGLDLVEGEIRGRPSAPGKEKFSVSVMDSAAAQVEGGLSLEVLAKPEAGGDTGGIWKYLAYLILYLVVTWTCTLIDKLVNRKIMAICVRDGATIEIEPRTGRMRVKGGTAQTLEDINRVIKIGGVMKWIVRIAGVVAAVLLYPYLGRA